MSSLCEKIVVAYQLYPLFFISCSRAFFENIKEERGSKRERERGGGFTMYERLKTEEEDLFASRTVRLNLTTRTCPPWALKLFAAMKEALGDFPPERMEGIASNSEFHFQTSLGTAARFGAMWHLQNELISTQLPGSFSWQKGDSYRGWTRFGYSLRATPICSNARNNCNHDVNVAKRCQRPPIHLARHAFYFLGFLIFPNPQETSSMLLRNIILVPCIFPLQGKKKTQKKVDWFVQISKVFSRSSDPKNPPCSLAVQKPLNIQCCKLCFLVIHIEFFIFKRDYLRQSCYFKNRYLSLSP